MTLTLFITLFTILSIVNSLLTETVKRTIGTYKPTLVAAALAAVVGWGGGICAYILMGIVASPASIVCLIILAPAIFVGSTCGYDKVKEIIEQIGLIA